MYLLINLPAHLDHDVGGWLSFSSFSLWLTADASFWVYVSVELRIFFFVCDTDIPMSVGIIDPQTNPAQLNTIEYLWDPAKHTSAFIQVCGYIVFHNPRKKGCDSM